MRRRRQAQYALSRPTQFRLVSSRRQFDFDRSASMGTHFEVVRNITLDLVKQAQADGDLPAGAAQEVALGLRAVVYGLSRRAPPAAQPAAS